MEKGEKDQFIKMGAIIYMHVKNENTLAVAVFLGFYSQFCPDENKVYDDNESLTDKQRQEKIKSRLEQHA